MNACLFTANTWYSIKQIAVGNDSQWFWAMVQAIGVIVTLWMIWRQIKLQRMGNMLSSIAPLNERWNGERSMKARQQICRAFLDEKDSGPLSAEIVAAFFEELGVYESHRVFDMNTIWNLYGDYVENYWPILLPKVEKLRERDASAYTHFEELWKKCDKRSKKDGFVSGAKTSEQLKTFAESEVAKK